MRSEMISFAANGGSADGYLAVPDQPGPGVLVIQEWWGLVGHIKEVADRFAEAGFTALAPDLFHGEQTTSPDEAGKLFMALEVDRAEQDLRGAADHLATVASGESVGVVGFCMGGQLALYAASRSPRIGACVDFYGVHPNVHPDYPSIRCPVLGLFAENDGFVNAEAVNNLAASLAGAGVAHEFHTYSGTDHAFFNDARPSYDAEASADAWNRVIRLFRGSLG
ncbi:MAG: dienelactone hydrolase family protein [Acidobacteria bacterium]|nr:dienelactone hydrolase family protein [Acidobacteriota bacterium]